MVGQHNGGGEYSGNSSGGMDSRVTHGGDSYAPAHLRMGETYGEESEPADVSDGEVNRLLEGGKE